jgi:hypothetical protein
MTRSKTKPPATPLPLTVGSLARWVCPSSLAIAGLGVWPTWLVAGSAGAWAGLIAAGVVLGVMLLTGWVTVWAARRGAGTASSMFMGLSLARLVLCPAILWTIHRTSSLPSGSLWAWLIIMYVWCLATEVGWMVRTLAQRAPAAEPTTDEAKPAASAYHIFDDDSRAQGDRA